MVIRIYGSTFAFADHKGLVILAPPVHELHQWTTRNGTRSRCRDWCSHHSGSPPLGERESSRLREGFNGTRIVRHLASRNAWKCKVQGDFARHWTHWIPPQSWVKPGNIVLSSPQYSDAWLLSISRNYVDPDESKIGYILVTLFQFDLVA